MNIMQFFCFGKVKSERGKGHMNEGLEVLREKVAAGFAGTQAQLCEELNDLGFQVDQSWVSRSLSRLGAERRRVGGRRVYVLPPESSVVHFKGPLQGILLAVLSNESQIVVRTITGAAQFVAARIDQRVGDGILGCIAGDDTILVIPRSLREIEAVKEELRNLT